MGGEKAYDLMPFYRYVWIINFLLFEESPWMFMFILTFFPIVIYRVFREILGKTFAKYFLIFWFFIPIFEAFLFLSLGFSLVLIMPLHNFIFTNKFIPLTIAAYKTGNLGASPSDYFILFKSLLTFSLDLGVLKKIINHVKGEIKLYEIWYHLSIAISIFYAVKKNSPFIIRCLAISSLSLISLLLFYHVGGRYSYLSWTLSLIVLSYSIKNDFLPFIKRIKI